MEVCFQAKIVGYQHAAMRREVGRIVHRYIGGGLHSWLALISKILAIILCVAFSVLSALYALGRTIVDIQNGGVILFVLIAISMTLLVIAVGCRKGADPLKEYLWPPEAAVLAVSFWEDRIQAEETHILHQLSFHSVQTVMETEAAYYLFVGEEHVLMVRKREFTVGDPEQFRDFIQQKTGRPVEFVK